MTDDELKTIKITKEQAVILILDDLDGIEREAGRVHDKIYHINDLAFRREREQCISEMNKILRNMLDLYRNVCYILNEMESEFIGEEEKESEE
ncbi:MAG: hypothetical protein IJJ20_03440 [Thermoguttaceae bacterium]|nr:hypothetical protein [Thermoguttaceae bacterium]